MISARSPIQYIRAGKSHVGLLVDSRIDFLTEFWGMQDQALERELRAELTRFFTEEIPANTYLAWLAFDGEHFAGVGGMKIYRRPGGFRSPDGWTGYIMNMYTPPKYRRRGIASQLLDKLIRSGKEQGVSFFELHATASGEPVYAKAGFAKHSEPVYRKLVL